MNDTHHGVFTMSRQVSKSKPSVYVAAGVHDACMSKSSHHVFKLTKQKLVGESSMLCRLRQG